MATIADIEEAKSEAIAILEGKIDEAVSLRNSGFAGLEPVIDRLKKQRTSLLAQDYVASLDAPAMMRALQSIKAATADMRAAAATLKTAPQFIANIGRLEDAANMASSALASSLPGQGGSTPIKPPR